MKPLEMRHIEKAIIIIKNTYNSQGHHKIMEEDSLRYWIIPIVCMAIIMGAVFPYSLYYQVTTVTPNALTEFEEIKQMSCEEITARNALGSYWIPNNGIFAREKVDGCLDAQIAYKDNLKEIKKSGNHVEKLKAGFTKLWFGVYDHPDLPFSVKPAIVKILSGTMTDNDLFPKQITVIIGYNNTIKFHNLDDTIYFIGEDHGKWNTGIIKPDQTATVTIDEAGQYGYYAKPWLTGTLTVLEP